MHHPRLAPVIPACRGTIPVAAVARTRKEQVVLRNRKEMRTDGPNASENIETGDEDAPNDDTDDESQESDGSDSGSESERDR